MINEKLIYKAWAHLRETNSSIPDETIDFMKDSAIQKLKNVAQPEGGSRSDYPELSAVRAWDLYRDLVNKYDNIFTGWLYQEFCKDRNTLSYGYIGAFWLLNKPEIEAIEIMNRFISEHGR